MVRLRKVGLVLVGLIWLSSCNLDDPGVVDNPPPNEDAGIDVEEDMAPTNNPNNMNNPVGAIASVSVEPVTASVNVFGRTQLVATAKTSTGSEVSGVEFTWTATNPDVASVDEDGWVTGEGEGSAQIIASAGGFEGSATITVQDLCGNLGTLSVGVRLPSNLSAEGCALPGGFPARGFEITTTDTENVRIHLESDEFAPAVLVQASDGTQVDLRREYARGRTATASAELQGGETYRIFASTTELEATGAFTLSVLDSCDEGSEVIHVGQQVQNFLGPGDCDRGDGNEDIYSFRLLQDTMANITFEPTGWTGRLTLSSQQSELESISNDPGPASITRNLPAGSYNIVINASGRAGAYQFTLGGQVQNCASASDIPLGSAALGVVNGSSCDVSTVFNGWTAGRGDVWRVNVSERGRYRVDLATGFSSRLAILGTGGNLVEESNSGGFGTSGSAIERVLEPGQYTIVAGSTGGANGGYALYFSRVPGNLRRGYLRDIRDASVRYSCRWECLGRRGLSGSDSTGQFVDHPCRDPTGFSSADRY